MSDDLRTLLDGLNVAAYGDDWARFTPTECLAIKMHIESLLARAEAAERRADELQRDAGRLGAALVGAEAECARLRQQMKMFAEIAARHGKSNLAALVDRAIAEGKHEA